MEVTGGIFSEKKKNERTLLNSKDVKVADERAAVFATISEFRWKIFRSRETYRGEDRKKLVGIPSRLINSLRSESIESPLLKNRRSSNVRGIGRIVEVRRIFSRIHCPIILCPTRGRFIRDAFKLTISIVVSRLIPFCIFPTRFKNATVSLVLFFPRRRHRGAVYTRKKLKTLP